MSLRITRSLWPLFAALAVCWHLPVYADTTADFFDAAKQGNTARLGALLDTSPALVNATNSRGDSPLVVAISARKIDAVRLLLDRHADVNAADRFGFTPLMSAASETKPLFTALLIQRGANVRARSQSGTTPLHRAVGWSQCGTETVKLLLDHGAEVDAQTSEGETPLHWLARYGEKAVGVVDVAQLLIARGANVKAKQKNGDTPLHCAVLGDSQDLIDFLMAHGAEINARGKEGMTPLHLAYSARCIKVLLSHGAKINAADDRGATPLMRQAEYGDVEQMKALLKAGANVKLKDRDGKTAYDYAKRGNNARVFPFLRADAHP